MRIESSLGYYNSSTSALNNHCYRNTMKKILWLLDAWSLAPLILFLVIKGSGSFLSVEYFHINLGLSGSQADEQLMCISCGFPKVRREGCVSCEGENLVLGQPRQWCVRQLRSGCRLQEIQSLLLGVRCSRPDRSRPLRQDLSCRGQELLLHHRNFSRGR